MPQFNPFAIAAFLTATTCFFLAGLVFVYARMRVHRIWVCFFLSVAVWAFFIFLAAVSPQAQQAYAFWRTGHAFGVFISICYFHFACLFCGLRYKWLIRISYLYGLGFIFLHFYNQGYLIYDGTEFLFGSIHFLKLKNLNFTLALSFWWFLSFFASYLLYRYSKQHKDETGQQARLWVIFQVIGYTGGCSTFLPMYGIHFYPWTLFFLPIYALLISYVIFKYQFLNVRVVLERSIVYSFLIAVVTLAYLCIVIAIEKFSQTLFGYQSVFVSFFLAFFIGILFIPLRNKIQHVLDRSLFQGTQVEIAAQNERLRQEVADKEKFKVVAALASGMVHEIRNPLAAIKTFVEKVPEKKDNPQFLADFSRIVGREVERINTLVSNLLEFSKPTPPRMRKVDIHELIHDVLGFLKGEFVKGKVEVRMEFFAPHPSPLPERERDGERGMSSQNNPLIIHADPNQLRQVFLNLFLNAVQAMPSGGTLIVRSMEFKVRSKKQEINLRTPNSKLPALPAPSRHGAGGKPSTINVSVQDTGTGIPPEVLKNLFKPFHTTKEKGTGLGLSVCKTIIENHQGKIKVESPPKGGGSGTRFVIELPITKRDGGR